MKHDVFISFSFSDRDAAERLVNILSSRYGISCWICTYDLNGGNLYKDLIPEAIDVAKVVVFVQSEYAIASREIPKEIGIAFDAEKTIIPFRLDDSPLKGALRYDLYGLEYIDGTIPSFEERIAELADCILRILGKATHETNRVAARSVNRLESTPLGFSEIFYGRDDDLMQLHEAFKTRNVVFLHGMGGIGKSELAKQYIKMYRSEYTTVVFAQYDGSLATLLANDDIFKIKGLVRKSKADGSQQNDEEYAAVKLNVLKEISDEHTLILLDNFDVTGDPMLEAFTADVPYRLIVTSRLLPERGKYYVQAVKELSEEILRDLVVEFANPDTTMVDREDPAFHELFEITSRHTLTLELIARYMEEKCIDEIGEMVNLLKKQQITLLADSENEQRAMSIRNLFRMTEMSEKEQNFLRWLALAPLEGIGQKLFREWCGTEVFVSRTRLASLGLIRLNPTEKKISMHPIVRQIVLSELKVTLENSETFFKNVISSIYLSWNWPLGQKLAVAELSDTTMDRLGKLNEENYTLYYTFGILRNFVLDYDRVIPFWQNLYDYALTADGENSLRAGLAAYRAGWFCQNCNLDAMKLWLEDRAYPILKSNKKEVPMEYPHLLTNLGTLYIKQYDADPRQEYLKRSGIYLDEAMREVILAHETAKANGDKAVADNTYIKRAGAYMEMAELAIRKKAFDAAKQAIIKATDILPAENKTDHAYLTALTGRLYYMMDRPADAATYFEEALMGYNQVFLDNNAYSMRVHTLLAKCLEKQGETDAAREHWQKAQNTAQILLSEDHPILKEIKENLNSIQN